MKVLIAFLCLMFILSGSRRFGRLLQRPVIVALAAIALAGSYYSIRIVQ